MIFLQFSQEMMSWPWFSSQSWDLAASQSSEFWLELRSAEKEWVRTVAGGVNFSYKVLQRLPSHIWTGPPGLPLFQYVEALGQSWLPGEICHQVTELSYSFAGGSSLPFQDPTTAPRPAKESLHRRQMLRFVGQNVKVSLDKSPFSPYNEMIVNLWWDKYSLPGYSWDVVFLQNPGSYKIWNNKSNIFSFQIRGLWLFYCSSVERETWGATPLQEWRLYILPVLPLNTTWRDGSHHGLDVATLVRSSGSGGHTR